ncbi:MAG: hypothetical protein EYC68_00200 [Chloroflexota bacterium]|nr:MAG: hypothetical protein EYC68_00200 [Chloroflexota bacterium]
MCGIDSSSAVAGKSLRVTFDGKLFLFGMPNAPSLDLKIYAGKWIAIVRGRVVASGKSAHETLLHCRAMRLKDEPILRFIPQAHNVRKKKK